MAKTAAQPKTMESNHKVASVLSTGLFAILCVLIAFPLLAGFFASFQEGREVVMKGMSLNLDFSKMHLDNYKYLFSGNEDSRKYFMWYKNSLILTLITVVLTLLVCYFIAMHPHFTTVSGKYITYNFHKIIYFITNVYQSYRKLFTSTAWTCNAGY